MKDLKTIMVKSLKLKAIRLTGRNILKVIYTLRGMGLIHNAYRTEHYKLFYGNEFLTNVKVGDWFVAHPDKSLSIVTDVQYRNNYFSKS